VRRRRGAWEEGLCWVDGGDWRCSQMLENERHVLNVAN